MDAERPGQYSSSGLISTPVDRWIAVGAATMSPVETPACLQRLDGGAEEAVVDEAEPDRVDQVVHLERAPALLRASWKSHSTSAGLLRGDPLRAILRRCPDA